MTYAFMMPTFSMPMGFGTTNITINSGCCHNPFSSYCSTGFSFYTPSLSAGFGWYSPPRPIFSFNYSPLTFLSGSYGGVGMFGSLTMGNYYNSFNNSYNNFLNYGLLNTITMQNSLNGSTCNPYKLNLTLPKIDWTIPTKPVTPISANSTNTSNLSATSAKAEKAAQIAEHELAQGVRENGSSNDSAGIRKYKNGAKNSHQWCGYFTSYCFGAGQGTTPIFGFTGQSQAIRKKAEAAGHYAKKNTGYTPKRGDIAIWKKTEYTGHVGVVTKVYADGSFDVIEGNSSNRVKKNHYKSQSQANLSSTCKFDGFVKANEWLG